MDQLPIFLNLKGRHCLVVGAGAVGISKALVLASAGASIDIVSPELDSRIEELADNHRITIHCERFDEHYLVGKTLVIAATNDSALNRDIVRLAKHHGALANAVTDRDVSHFIMPAIIDRSPVIISVSTGGAAPVLAQFIRARLETWIPHSFGRLATIAGEFREKVKSRLNTLAERRAFWQQVFTGPTAEMVFAGRENDARERIRQTLNNEPPSDIGEVYLVGAGPGDPDLITFRAMRLMQQADVVIYDRLVSGPILDLVRRDAERIYVGKQRSLHTLAQSDINALLVKLARNGRKVLRLKGGDPFIFGRGGEEIQTLAEERISFQVVPGITAANGCAAYAGIPLTHRDHAHACVFVTGDIKNGHCDLNFDQLALPHQTVVIYMGLIALPIICRQLIAHGMPADMPIALIQQGSTPNQRVLTATVATLAAAIDRHQPQPPALAIIGTVVTLREKLRWFEPEHDQV